MGTRTFAPSVRRTVFSGTLARQGRSGRKRISERSLESDRCTWERSHLDVFLARRHEGFHRGRRFAKNPCCGRKRLGQRGSSSCESIVDANRLINHRPRPRRLRALSANREKLLTARPTQSSATGRYQSHESLSSTRWAGFLIQRGESRVRFKWLSIRSARIVRTAREPRLMHPKS